MNYIHESPFSGFEYSEQLDKSTNELYSRKSILGELNIVVNFLINAKTIHNLYFIANSEIRIYDSDKTQKCSKQCNFMVTKPKCSKDNSI